MTFATTATDAAWLIEFVNEYADSPRRRAGETDSPYPAVGSLGNPPPPSRALPEEDLADVADRLYAALAAPPTERASSLGELVGGITVRPRVEAHGGAPRVLWEVDDPRDALLLAGCLAIIELAGVVGNRIGVCDADRCIDVYFDRSQAATRRYCSQTCQNRAKVAAYRARQRRGRDRA